MLFSDRACTRLTLLGNTELWVLNGASKLLSLWLRRLDGPFNPLSSVFLNRVVWYRLYLYIRIDLQVLRAKFCFISPNRNWLNRALKLLQCWNTAHYTPNPNMPQLKSPPFFHFFSFSSHLSLLFFVILCSI